MGTVLAYALVIALILPLSVLLATSEEGRSTSTYRAPAAVALALGAVFFALGYIHPADASGAWLFRAFYGSLCVITVAAANLLVCLERSHA
ncbi:hypothetical protein [Planctomyces sp. SH-PL62]|uniref:hypothetical protein n=1 Tax=Planctomyces sp. SH-PL62 TaxID=1636152 RepID=UPI00078CAAF8|nr:hypothetical protein [Planctomyces sp. SH-PL62]AMV36913.1 hypothetical protein VT85_05745 [Planctomyces sp. SH-PL62]